MARKGGGLTVITAEHPIQGTLRAAIDPDARFITPRVTELKFAALLVPCSTLAEAQAALIQAGATLPKDRVR